MNKEQQIEEMARDLPFLTLERDVHISSTNVEKRAWTLSEEDNKIIAEALYNAGYRQIDENCAVITKAELKEYKRQAVKEFAERLKEKAHKGAFRDLITYKFIEHDYTITESKLNELLKEYEQ